MLKLLFVDYAMLHPTHKIMLTYDSQNYLKIQKRYLFKDISLCYLQQFFPILLSL